MTEPECFLPDGRALVTAAELGKLRLVRVLVDGGAQVNERNARGETPLLAACRSLRSSPPEPMLKVIQFLLDNRAEPNIQDKAGRTALMYACMERAGAELASALIAAGADATMEDYSGASALVYAINAQDPDTLTVLLDACRSRGREIIIIATDLSCDASASRNLNVPPSPDTSPVSCMSPSDIELNTNSPNSDGENFFSFRADGSPVRSRSRLRSEPWLAIQNLAHLSHSYEKSLEDAAEEEHQEKDSLRRAAQVEERGKLRDASERRNTFPDLLPAPSLRLPLSGSDTLLHPLSGSDTLRHSLSGSDTLLHPLSGSDTLRHPLSGSDTLLHPLSGSDTLLHPLSGSDTLRHSLSGSDTLLHPLSGSDTLLRPLSGSDTLLRPLSGSDTLLHRTPFGLSAHRTGSLFLAPPDGLPPGNKRKSREPLSGFLPPLPDRSGGNEPIRDALALGPARRHSLQLQETPDLLWKRLL